ncbi:MAG: AEC family transporter [Clostridiales bacterium]|nr:AEC family transporter [Clostridiales bacterium]
MLAFQLSLQLIILIAVGFVVWRRGFVDENFDESLTSFILNFALPCMIIKSFSAEYSPEQMKNCAILLVLSIILLAFWYGMGQIVYRVYKGHTGRILRFGTMFTNFSFVGIPVVEALYGQTGLLYFVVFIVPIRMVYYSAAKPLLSPPGVTPEQKTFWQNLKGWLSPPVAAVFIGLIMYITGFSFPPAIDKTISGIGAVSSPMGMILCGITLGKNNVKSLLKLKYLRMPVLRNLILPAITIFIMYFLPVDPLVAKIVVIYSALPVASLLAAFTIQYDPDPEARLESAGSVFFSILACAVTIPLWAQAAEYLF